VSTFESNIIHIYGICGEAWLKGLPALVSNISKKFGLSGVVPVANLSYNFVATGFQGTKPIILKVGLDQQALRREASMLRVFLRQGAAAVVVEEDGVLILERAVPGVSLKSYFPSKEDKAIEITCTRLQQLHNAKIPETHNFPHIRDWLAALDKDWDIPKHYLQKARQLRDNLLHTQAKEVLLHGDLHHDNILQNGATWLVIDPKGVIGDPAYEVAAFVRNPVPELLTLDNAPNIIKYRIKRFAQILGLKPELILNWCFVQAALSWIWNIEDNLDTEYCKKLTEILIACE
jgi:streptomycin 6-kinase